jgi:2-methylcitrate dehydratase PrpD
MQQRSEMPVTELLCQYVSKLEYEDLSDSIVLRVKQLFIEYLRVVVLGSQRQWGKSIFSSFAGKGKSQIAVYEGMTDQARAALVNGTFAGGLDWDDTHVGSMLHPGIVIFPAAIAVAEKIGANGKKLIEALTAAYDAMIRIGLCIQPSHFKKGFQSTATCGVFGAAVAAAKLMNFEYQNIVSTLGIAGSYASGLAQFYKYGSEVKRIHAGKSSESGVMAALLVNSGIDGPPYILEGEFGFCRAYSDDYFPEFIADGLAKDYKIMETTIRPNACSARIQASLEAAFYIMHNYEILLSDIKEIVVGIPEIIAGRLTAKEPPNLQAAQLSVPFSVALALWKCSKKDPNDYLSVEDYETNIQNPEVRFLSSNVECIVDEDVEKKTKTIHVPSRLEINLKQGQKIVHAVDVPRGSPEKPFTLEKVKARFISQVESILCKGNIDDILEKIDNLQDLPEVSQITKFVKTG